MPSPVEFGLKVNKVRAFLQRDTYTIFRNEAVKHFRQSFTDEGFTDATLVKWKDISEKRKEQKRKANGDLPGILYDSGNLKRSIVGSERPGQVVISSDMDYADRHNSGLKGMPKRQFIGPSKVLDKKITTALNKNITKLFGF